jgi:hypothetical protein
MCAQLGELYLRFNLSGLGIRILPLPEHACPRCDTHTNKSHSIKVPQKAQVDQKTNCAVLLLSVAFFSSLFPLPMFSVVR